MYFRSGIINLKKPFIFLVGSSLDVENDHILVRLKIVVYF